MKSDVVYKTPTEIALNKFYMQFIRSKNPTPERILEQFKAKVERIKRDNYIYRNQ